MFCRHCKAHRDSTKKLEIWKVPPILLVHLKRSVIKAVKQFLSVYFYSSLYKLYRSAIFDINIISCCGGSSCRFSYEGRWKQKLQTSVDFPLDSLDLAQYVIGPKQSLKRYNLYGVSVSETEMTAAVFTALV